MHGTSSPQSLSTTLQWIAERAKSKEFRYWTLAHHMTLELLHDSYNRVRKDAAPGVDQQTAKEYSKDLAANLEALHRRLTEQRYVAPAIRRVWIPKGDGSTKQRPLGLPTVSVNYTWLQRAFGIS